MEREEFRCNNHIQILFANLLNMVQMCNTVHEIAYQVVLFSLEKKLVHSFCSVLLHHQIKNINIADIRCYRTVWLIQCPILSTHKMNKVFCRRLSKSTALPSVCICYRKRKRIQQLAFSWLSRYHKVNIWTM